MTEFDRASAYAAKIPSAGKGERNRCMNGFVWRIMERFSLVEEEIMRLGMDWARACDPPMEDREAMRTIKTTFNRAQARGIVGSKRMEPESNEPRRARTNVTFNVTNPADELRAELEDAMEGRRRGVGMPWDILANLTNALSPGTITVLCALKGSSKSLFILEAAAFWSQAGESWAIYELEDERKFHMRRILAQLAKNANLTNDDWVRSNPEPVKVAWEEHYDRLNEIGKRIHESSAMVNTDNLLAWLEVEAARNRILVIDPVTARNPSAWPWVDDQQFVMQAKHMLKKTQCSVILVTHPPKSYKSDEDVWGEDCAGGAAFERFTQTVLFMRYLRKPEEVEVRTGGGLVERSEINRVCQLRKTRNGKGQGSEIGFWFSPTDLRHYERGVIV